MRGAVVATLTAVLLAGCYAPVGVPIGAGADPDEIPRRVAIGADVAEARERAHATLAELGFSRSDAAADRWTRRFPEDEVWAFCPPLRVEDDDTYDTVHADGGEVRLALEVVPADDGARVTIRPRFLGRYRDPVAFAGTRRRPCNSFGVVETRFVEAMRAAG
ncbi:MAG: hypothetical protein GVY33_01700 [Alphaproteobacteria bacterium]|jgi:hypothetical protein|nr:hypothetical protein [Alphaproteobacteria bacterium]